MGKIHSGRIEHSERHRRVLRALMAAEHPLSGEELSARIQAEIGRIPQAVSTTIGEMRSEANIADGYVVSYSTRWKAAGPGDECGMRTNGDGSITFIIAQATESWHDGRPRYWLLAAPGWMPKWLINEHGALIQNSRPKIQEERPAKESDPGLRCKNPACGKPLAPEVAATGAWCCDDACREAWKQSLKQEPVVKDFFAIDGRR